MTPDPAGMAAADPANPQSWNRYGAFSNRDERKTEALPNAAIHFPERVSPEFASGTAAASDTGDSVEALCHC